MLVVEHTWYEWKIITESIERGGKEVVACWVSVKWSTKRDRKKNNHIYTGTLRNESNFSLSLSYHFDNRVFPCRFWRRKNRIYNLKKIHKKDKKHWLNKWMCDLSLVICRHCSSWSITAVATTTSLNYNNKLFSSSVISFIHSLTMLVVLFCLR